MPVSNSGLSIFHSFLRSYSICVRRISTLTFSGSARYRADYAFSLLLSHYHDTCNFVVPSRVLGVYRGLSMPESVV